MPGFLGLITDFGNSVYDGIVEAVIRSIDPEVSVVRLEDNVPPFSVLAGSYVAYSSYRWLPPRSALVVVVDPGVGTRRRAVIVETRNYHMVAPDNGVIYEAAVEDGIRGVYAIDIGSVRKEASKFVRAFLSAPVSSTFHGRDLFAPAAALLLRGVDPDELGTPTPTQSLTAMRLRYRRGDGGRLQLRVVFVDRFGNLALSATGSDLALKEGSLVRVAAGGRSFLARRARTFGDVRAGEWVLYLNSFGFWELAVNQGNASAALGAGIGDEVLLEVVS
ncbi:MAG: SAM hydrolase/SAM-dependent halogenase family protein [Acidilobus sp.]